MALYTRHVCDLVADVFCTALSVLQTSAWTTNAGLLPAPLPALLPDHLPDLF
jgi:hypothetical protein